MDLIKNYIVALTNLYGQVPADVITDIYNSQNEGQISEDDVEVYFYEDLSKQHVYVYKKHFVHETIMEFNDFKSMRKKKADKPYYIPDKEELLKYSDMRYYEKPKQYHNLLTYLKKNFFSGDHDKAESLCQNIRWECLEGPDMQQVFDMFNTAEINFKDENQVNEVMQLVMELANNVRLWENNGHTPQEIFEKFEKPNLKPLPDKPFVYTGGEQTVVKKKKIGRNDPCPCGSGKKYKKCCLGKE
ncbi:MAG TPA: SEC-C metal-binding domain-containing protein [Atribacterota bacterium]|nr:SEC-C metal-binding domain-containing protein [Atribacterota bacterium]